MITSDRPNPPDSKDALASNIVRTGSLGYSQTFLRPFDNVPRYAGWSFVMQMIPCGVFIAAICIFFPIASLDPKLNHNAFGGAIVLAIFSIGAVCSFATARRLSFVWMRMQKERDLKTLPLEHGTRYVGVSYTAGDWAYRGDTSWDRGWLSIDNGFLIFRGFGPSFRLPRECIDEIVIRRTRSILTNSLPRLYVFWHDEDGNQNALSFEVRDAGTKDKTIEQTNKLEAWMRDSLAKSSDAGVKPNASHLPFASASLRLGGLPGQRSITAKDRLIAGAWAAALLVIVIGGLVAFSRATKVKTSGMGGMAGIFAIGTYNTVIVQRVRRRNPESGPDDSGNAK